MSIPTTAASMNNQGIQLMESGNFFQAISIFNRSVSILNQALACGDNESCVDGSSDCFGCNPDSGQVENRLTPLCPFRKLHQELSPSTRSEKDEVFDYNNARFVFKNPILVPSSLVMGLTCCKMHLVKLSFIQLYNLGVAHHLFATSSSSEAASKRQCLQKALSLYELSYNIQLMENDYIQLSALQVLALVNNIAQIHAALDHVDDVQQSLQTLLGTLILVQHKNNSNNSCEEDENNDRDEFDGFWANVQSLIFRKGSPPAPAA